MYNLFACKDFGDYHGLYLRIDVFILADVFETFRNVCLKVYNLDPAYFFSAPNLSWDAMLITTRAEIGLLTDIEMLLFCERAIRGGVNGSELCDTSEPTIPTQMITVQMNLQCMEHFLTSPRCMPELCNSLCQWEPTPGEQI